MGTKENRGRWEGEGHVIIKGLIRLYDTFEFDSIKFKVLGEDDRTHTCLFLLLLSVKESDVS